MTTAHMENVDVSRLMGGMARADVETYINIPLQSDDSAGKRPGEAWLEHMWKHVGIEAKAPTLSASEAYARAAAEETSPVAEQTAKAQAATPPRFTSQR